MKMSEEPTLDGSKPKKLTIQGQIRQTDGRPLSDVVVPAFDKEMRSEDWLGSRLVFGFPLLAITK